MAEAFGLDLPDLPDGLTPVEAVVVVKCMALGDPEGGTSAIRYSSRATDSLSICEALGMLRAAQCDLEAQYLESLEPR